jgi:hypothetical protein
MYEKKCTSIRDIPATVASENSAGYEACHHFYHAVRAAGPGI